MYSYYCNSFSIRVQPCSFRSPSFTNILLPTIRCPVTFWHPRLVEKYCCQLLSGRLVSLQVEGELEYRMRQKVALQTMLKEKMLEIDRQNLQYQSLLRVESEQLALIERLSNSETITEQEEAPHK